MKSCVSRTPTWKEARRLRAVKLREEHWSEGAIAEALGVTKSAVCKWCKAAERQGVGSLCDKDRPGAPRRLKKGQLDLIPEFLWHGAEAYGFRGELWTCARIGDVIEREFGISYHPAHVSRLLKAIGWTPQKPVTRASQRDEEAILKWRSQKWPELKDAAKKEKREIVFIDESGFYLLPAKVRTYAPRGQTPLIQVFQTKDHLSAICGVTITNQLYSMVRVKAINSLDAIRFLRHLLLCMESRLLVIWDNSPIHRSNEVKAFLAKNGAKIHIEALPPYAPDLNPTEGAWNHLKRIELRNVSCQTLTDLQSELLMGIERLRSKPNKIKGFFAQAQLKQ